jgi:drug/metabolite transporter (DMT)-like permease
MQIDRSYFKLHFIVILWGFTAILGLLITLNFIELVFYRTLLATITLAIIIALRREGFKLGRSEIIKLLLTGATIALHWMLFFGAARYSNASVSLIGLSTTTLWTSFIEPTVYKRKISFLEVVFALIVILGLYIIYKDEFTYGLGLVMSIGAALLAATFTVLNHKFVRKHHHSSIVFYEMLGAWLTTIPFLWLLQASDKSVLSLPNLSDFGYLLVLALVCTVYANAEATKLLKKFSAFASNLVITMEPVYGILLALIFFGDSEKMKPGFYLGTLIIIVSVVVYPLLLKKITRENR